jgi:hypothetical protein
LLLVVVLVQAFTVSKVKVVAFLLDWAFSIQVVIVTLLTVCAGLERCGAGAA